MAFGVRGDPPTRQSSVPRHHGRQTAPAAERDDLRVLLKGVVVGIGASCIAFLAAAATPGTSAPSCPGAPSSRGDVHHRRGPTPANRAWETRQGKCSREPDSPPFRSGRSARISGGDRDGDDGSHQRPGAAVNSHVLSQIQATSLRSTHTPITRTRRHYPERGGTTAAMTVKSGEQQRCG